MKRAEDLRWRRKERRTGTALGKALSSTWSWRETPLYMECISFSTSSGLENQVPQMQFNLISIMCLSFVTACQNTLIFNYYICVFWQTGNSNFFAKEVSPSQQYEGEALLRRVNPLPLPFSFLPLPFCSFPFLPTPMPPINGPH